MNKITLEDVRAKVAALQAAPGISVRYEHLAQKGGMVTKFGGVFPGIMWLQSGETGLALFIGDGNPPHETDDPSTQFPAFELEFGRVAEMLLGGKRKLFLSTATVEGVELAALYQNVAAALPLSGILHEKVVVYVPQERDACHYTYPPNYWEAGKVIKKEVFSRLGITPIDETDATKQLPLPDSETLNVLIRDAIRKYWWDPNGNDRDCFQQARQVVMREYVSRKQLVYSEEDRKVFGYADTAGYIPKKGVYFSEYCSTSGGGHWDRCIFATPRAANAIGVGMARQRREYAQLKTAMRENLDHPERRGRCVSAPFIYWNGLWKHEPVTGPEVIAELKRRQALLCRPKPLEAFKGTNEFEAGTGRQVREQTPAEEFVQSLLVLCNGIVAAMGYVEKDRRDPDPDPERMLEEGGLDECHRAFRWLIEEVQRRWQQSERNLTEVISEVRRVAKEGVIPHDDYHRLCEKILRQFYHPACGLPEVVAFKKAIVVSRIAYLPDIISPELLARLDLLAPSYDESKGHPIGAFDEIQEAEELPADIAELLGVPVKRVPYAPVPDPKPKEWTIKNS
jgi:hypothetical protein